jgi:hypothetical protein
VEEVEGREGFGVVGNNFATLGEFKFTYLKELQHLKSVSTEFIILFPIKKL